MFGGLPNSGVPGFRIGKPEDTPGFRVSDDGSGGGAPTGGAIYPVGDRNSNFHEGVRPFLADLQDAAEAVGARANAAIQGAYSVFPGSYNALRALARGAGLLGAEEARRSAQESKLIDAATIQMLKHPAATYHAAREAFSALNANPLFMYYLLGRLAMGGVTGLGLLATPGDALRAVENGHDAIDSLFKYGGAGGGAPSGP